MLNRKLGIACALLGAVGAGCFSTDSDLLDTEGCEEFRPGEAIDADVEPAVLRFMRASATFSGASAELEAEVLEACANIARDLGAKDTWSALDDTGEAVSNDQGTGACDVAAKLVEE